MDRSLLSSVCRMLVALGLYPVFEMAFLEHSELFYQAEGSRRAVSDDVRGDGDSDCVCAPIYLLLTSGEWCDVGPLFLAHSRLLSFGMVRRCLCI